MYDTRVSHLWGMYASKSRDRWTSNSPNNIINPDLPDSVSNTKGGETISKNLQETLMTTKRLPTLNVLRKQTKNKPELKYPVEALAASELTASFSNTLRCLTFRQLV